MRVHQQTEAHGRRATVIWPFCGVGLGRMVVLGPDRPRAQDMDSVGLGMQLVSEWLEHFMVVQPIMLSPPQYQWAKASSRHKRRLFLRVARLGAADRKARGSLPLEFKALVSTDSGAEESWALCVAGVPGRLQVPEPQLAECELDVKALYQPEKAVVVNCGERKVRLQPVEQLAHRYQTLLRTQAETLMSELGGGAQGEDSR